MPLHRFASTDRLVLAVTALVIAAVVTVAVWSATLPAGGDTPSIDANVSDRYDALDALSATRTTVIERNETTHSTRRYDATLVPGSEKRRLRLVDGSTDRYDLHVSNGSVLWLHERDRATVTRIPLSGPTGTADTADRIQRLLARTDLAAGETGEDPPAVAPLPVVPRERTPPRDGPDAGYTVRYTGTEAVGDRATYVVRITPRSDGDYRQTLWLDTEWLYPLQRRTTWRDDGVRTELTTTYTNVTFNPTVPAGTFGPEIGPDTTVERTEAPETTVFSRVRALRANASMAVPAPDVPPSYELAYATRTEGRIRGVDLRYVNRTGRLTVSKYNFTYRAADPDERRRIDGRPATLTRGATTSVSWNCDTYRYTVRGNGVPEEQLLAVARSVGCR